MADSSFAHNHSAWQRRPLLLPDRADSTVTTDAANVRDRAAPRAKNADIRKFVL
jgi:hypothetical protein